VRQVKTAIAKSVKSLIRWKGLDQVCLNASRNRIRILMYHQISDQTLPLGVFKQQLNYIQQNFDTYWLREVPGLLKAIAQGHRLKRPAIVPTFDDGYMSQIYTAFPLMAAMKLKATVFLLSRPDGGMIWNHELICRMTELSESQIKEVCTANGLPAGPVDLNRIKDMVEQVKHWPVHRREKFTALIRQMTPGFKPSDWMKQEYELIGRNDLANISREYVEIGCHSATHPILPYLDDRRAYEEIVGAKADLEKIVGQKVETFCYPNGSYSPRDVALVKEHYACAVADLGFAGTDLPLLKRISAELDFEEFHWSLISGL
jgi:peptidoglycan/xylan/chitin deacetylase (PgdA/CDA1 family)